MRPGRRGLIVGVVVVALLAPLVHHGTRRSVQLAVWGVGAPFGPSAGPYQEKDCSFRNEDLSDAENAQRTSEACQAVMTTACGSLDLVYVDHYTQVVSRCVDRIPGCPSRYGMLPGRRVKFQCLSAPRSRWDPDRDEPYAYAYETETEK